MAMKPRKMRGGGAPKKMRGGGMAMKPEMMAKGGMTVSDLRKAAKDKGYKLVKAD
jgi:hypothetical protein